MEDPNLPTETDAQPEPDHAPQPESEPTVPATEPATPPAGPTAEEKFAASTRENQILTARLAAFEDEKARRELTNTPTDSDLKAAFPEWEYMSATEQRLARESFTARRTSEVLLAKENEREADTRWNTDLELSAAKYPSLLGKEQQFKQFANKKQYRGTPIEVLVNAFLHTASTATPSTPTPAAPGLEPGTGGPKTPEKPKLLTAADLKTLRETDSAAYRKYIAEHDMSQLEY
jgi:hypothetical protein